MDLLMLMGGQAVAWGLYLALVCLCVLLPRIYPRCNLLPGSAWYQLGEVLHVNLKGRYWNHCPAGRIPLGGVVLLHLGL